MPAKPTIACPSCHALLELDVTVLQPATVGPAASTLPRRFAAGRFGFTEREAQVADRIVDGYSNRDIAAELKITHQVVKNYLFKIYNKVGCGSRAELVSMMLLGTATTERKR